MNTQNIDCFLFFLACWLISVYSSCNIQLQSKNIEYLSTIQLNRYNISDQCTTTCAIGYYGDFCQDLSQYASLPMGPWNQAGYCTSGPGILRFMTINVSSINSIQYTKKESILIGISNPGFTTNAGSKVSVISEISLYSRTITPVLYPTQAGSLNAIVVRNGVVYVSRTVKVSGIDTYDIAVLAAPMRAQRFVPTTVMAILFDVCLDKGTSTVFVYGSNTIRACYPNGDCVVWLTYISAVSGMLAGSDCQNTVYVSSLSKILKVTSEGQTTLKEAETTIYCMTGIQGINTLLYKSRNNMWQINLGTGATQSIALGTTQTQEVQCSTDVSENSNQILIVQNGVISTLEAMQEPCPFGTTSASLLCNSMLKCVACPPPPTNAYLVEGSASCDWVCRSGFSLVGSKCVGSVALPCPAFYRISLAAPGLCIPSVLPWADQGKYATSASFSAQKLFPLESSSYLLVSVGQSLIHAITGQFYLSSDGGSSWKALALEVYNVLVCYSQSQNIYYSLGSRNGILYTAFTQQLAGGFIQHCLWEVNATNAIASKGGLKVLKSWAVDSRLCSVTGDGEAIYALFCGNHYISSASRLGVVQFAPLIGVFVPGYTDGVFQAAKFSSPSSVVAFDSRLYITDTGNCVIREVDLVRGAVLTVAGTAAACQRADGIESAMLTHPAILSYTAYDGFFLFVDKNHDGHYAYIRQFHAPTSAVSTVQASPFEFSQISSLAASRHGVVVTAQRMYHLLSTTQNPCPAGTSSLAGSAQDTFGCLACPLDYYSSVETGMCLPCSTLDCSLPGQLLVPCQLNTDAYCRSCTNKPSNASVYIGPSSIPGTASGGGDCAWVYIPPCPIGYYNGTAGVCSPCPAWSTTTGTGKKSLADCACTGGGRWANGVCVVPSVFVSNPASCPPLSSCAAYTEPASQFPILPRCTSFDYDSASGVCPCQAGEYIQQIHPKVCTACPVGLYSPKGRGCMPCPYLTEPSTDKTSCRCTAGTTDTALSLAEPKCACGPGKAFSTLTGCDPCPRNTFNTAVRPYSATSAMQCTPCLAGTWSDTGATSCVPCPAGQYRLMSDTACQSCSHGSYAPYPTIPLCVDCVADCGGMKEIPCPTNDGLYMCSDCPPARPNSASNGRRDCATSCNTGFYELDGECVRCSQYYKATCPEGNRFVECGSYTDASCVGCVNASMPLNFATWSYHAAVPGGPSMVCEWVCKEGYSPKHPPLPGGAGGMGEAAWECVRAGEWSVWDLFTL